MKTTEELLKDNFYYEDYFYMDKIQKVMVQYAAEALRHFSDNNIKAERFMTAEEWPIYLENFIKTELK